MNNGNGSIVAGMAICWLLNIVQLGTGWLLLVFDERLIAMFYVMIAAIGLTQVGYVVPIWRVFLCEKINRGPLKGCWLPQELQRS
jgi:hypothetical protein